MSPHIEHNIPKDLLDSEDIETDDDDGIDISPSTRPPSRIASGNAPGILQTVVSGLILLLSKDNLFVP